MIPRYRAGLAACRSVVFRAADRHSPVFHGDGAILLQQQIDPDKDTILLWGGGLWRWSDPLRRDSRNG